MKPDLLPRPLIVLACIMPESTLSIIRLVMAVGSLSEAGCDLLITPSCAKRCFWNDSNLALIKPLKAMKFFGVAHCYLPDNLAAHWDFPHEVPFIALDASELAQKMTDYSRILSF